MSLRKYNSLTVKNSTVREDIMSRARKFEMELLKRLIKDYTKAKTKKEKSEILTKYCEIVGISREAAKKRFRRFIRSLTINTNTTFQRGEEEGGLVKNFVSGHRISY